MTVIDKDHRRRIGSYETPQATAAYMVEKLLQRLPDGARILDPAAGSGVFVRELLRLGVRAESITAWDTDRSAIPVLSDLTPSAKLQDGLTPGAELFDGIIGNPPYNSHECDYIRANREWLEREYSEIGLYNLYSLFAVSAIRKLREGGVAVLILLDSFLTNAYHRRFRRFLLDHCKIHEILLAPRRLFHAGRADVRTAILVLERCSDEKARAKSVMRLVDRISSEDAYADPPRVQLLPQQRYLDSNELRFHICVPDRIIDLVNHPPARLSDVVDGGAGISTGNDSRFLRTAEAVADDPDWVPFYKNSGGRAYLTQTDLRIHRDWRRGPASAPTYMARNARFYFREGISCSSMGVRFSACYLPPGCLFGVNANLFLREGASRDDLYYLLGFLNSTLAQYILRAVLNRTNMVTPGYVKKIPYISPDRDTQSRVASLVAVIMQGLCRNPSFEYQYHQREIDREILRLYRFSAEDCAAMDSFCQDLLERL